MKKTNSRHDRKNFHILYASLKQKLPQSYISKWIDTLHDSVVSLKFATKVGRHSGEPRITVRASANRNPGKYKENWITAFAVMTKGRRQLMR